MREDIFGIRALCACFGGLIGKYAIDSMLAGAVAGALIGVFLSVYVITKERQEKTLR